MVLDDAADWFCSFPDLVARIPQVQTHSTVLRDEQVLYFDFVEFVYFLPHNFMSVVSHTPNKALQPTPIVCRHSACAVQVQPAAWLSLVC
jgi:hypothetical protein